MSYRALRSPVCVVVVLAAFAGSARGDARADARAKLVEGARLLEAGNHAEALERFEAAYALVPSPKIHYNFGLAYRGLGRNADALGAFEEFLAKASDATPETRRAAQRLRTELAPKVATLNLAASEPGAAVTVDGRPVGNTPLATTVYLDPGPHVVRVEKAGMTTFSERVIASPGAAVNLAARMEAMPATRATGPAEAPRPAPPPADREDDDGDGGRRWYRGTAIASAVLATGALAYGVFQQLETDSRYEKFNEMCTGIGGPPADRATCAGLQAAGDSTQRKAIGGFVVAGALGATAALLFYLTPPEAKTTRAAWACGPETTLRGVTCAFTF